MKKSSLTKFNLEGSKILKREELKTVEGGCGEMANLLSWGLGFAGAGGAAVGLIIGLGVSEACSDHGRRNSNYGSIFIGY